MRKTVNVTDIPKGVRGTAAASLRDAFAKLHMNQTLDWNDLRYFLAVARNGSTIAAAKELGVNQSTVQRRLAVLEEAVGRKLVERLPSGYRLTGFGEELRPHAEAVEAAVANLDRKIASADTAPTGGCASHLRRRHGVSICPEDA